METNSAKVARLVSLIRTAQTELEELANESFPSFVASTHLNALDHLNDGLSNLELALGDIEHAQQEFVEVEQSPSSYY